MKKEYESLLNSGMFWEFYPELTGEWDKDKKQWTKIYYQLIKMRDKAKQ